MAAAPFGCCVKSRGKGSSLALARIFQYHLTMELAIADIEKSRGRGRPKVDATPILVRLAADKLAALDAWIAAQPEPRPTRPEAIRRLMELGLVSRPERDDSPKPHGDKLAASAGRRRKVTLGEPEEPDEQ